MARTGEMTIEDILFKLNILLDSGVDTIETDNDVYDMIKSLEKLSR